MGRHAAAFLLCFVAHVLSAAAISGFQPVSSGQVKEYNLTFSTTFAAPDCVERSVIVINGQLPGPTIDLLRGDRVRIHVHNQLYTDGLSVHWHGISHRDPWMDGSSFGAQCPIAPGETFTYEFNVTDQVGTFWYHAHFSTLRSEGAYGAFIVRPNPAFGDREPFAYDEERLLFIGDWYHKSTKDQLTGLDRALPLAFRFVGEPQSLLLNQRGVYNCTQGGKTLPTVYDQDCVACNQTDAQCTAQPIVTVTPGKTYRLRLINMAALSLLSFQVEGHTLTVVAVDAVPVAPLNVTYLDLASGERADVLLTANQPLGNYWIVTTVRMRPPATTPGKWVLNYEGVSNATLPAGNASAVAAAAPKWDDVAFSLAQTGAYKTPPGSPDTPPPTATRKIFMLGTQNRIDGQIRWPMNGVAWVFPPTPLLHSEYLNISGGYTRNVLPGDGPPLVYDYVNVVGSPPGYPLRKGQGVYDVTQGDVIDVIMQNGLPLNNRSDAHPWYFHQHNMWVLGQGVGIYNETVDGPKLNLVDPPLRRMFVQYPKGWTYIRFVAEVPGVWLLHCHIESHFHMGAAFAFNIKPRSGAKLPNPPTDTKFCGATTWLDLAKAYTLA